MRGLAGRIVMAVAVTVIVSLLALAALGFAGAALFLALREGLSPPLAALLTAGALLVVALLILGIARLVSRGSQRAATPAMMAAEAADLGAITAGLLGGRARALWLNHARDAIALAFAAGLVLGLSPRLRRALLRSLRHSP